MIESHKTAISRNKVSMPVRELEKLGLFQGRILDYGCGKGVDSDYLGAERFDPWFSPVMPEGLFDVVLMNYVLNVIPDRRDRIKAIRLAVSKLKSTGILILTSRTEKDILKSKTDKWQVHKDGYITPKNTFQVGISVDGLSALANEAIVLDTTILIPKKTAKFSVITVEKKYHKC